MRHDCRAEDSRRRLVVNSALTGTRWSRQRSADRPLILLAGVPLIWLVMLHVGPIYPDAEDQPSVATIRSSRARSRTSPSPTTRSSFRNRSTSSPFIRSFIFAAAATAVTLVVVYPVAYYVAKVVKPEGRSKALLLLLVPFWAGELIRTFSVIMLLANRGAVNVLLREIGLIDRPIPMLYTSFSLGFGLVYLVCLYMLLPLYSAIEKIPSPSARCRGRSRRRSRSRASAGSFCRCRATASYRAAAWSS